MSTAGRNLVAGHPWRAEFERAAGLPAGIRCHTVDCPDLPPMQIREVRAPCPSPLPRAPSCPARRSPPLEAQPLPQPSSRTVQRLSGVSWVFLRCPFLNSVQAVDFQPVVSLNESRGPSHFGLFKRLRSSQAEVNT